MKFINYLESITGIGIYPLIGLVIFVLFFTAVSIYLIKGSKYHFDEVSRIPLDLKENVENANNKIID
ncbi:MAG: CcoQ/FixQ family Cbb3-type cytochrome c oxidase assembly chaperone [Bacteroidetes bacterium]|nr:CcoQ/FixQ family Cbb3-type cytochrome c oxidase assembly chaperone [Bacteroidota bacterium]